MTVPAHDTAVAANPQPQAPDEMCDRIDALCQRLIEEADALRAEFRRWRGDQ